jgi:hypothetical protein
MRTVFLVLALAACGTTEPRIEPQQHLPFVPSSFSLYVSNQSFDISPVDIRIELDGALAVSGDFAVEGQHTWLLFELGLTPGTHAIRVTTTDANAVLDQTFEMDDRKYGVVMFWYYPSGSTEPTPPQFSLQIQDDQPYFQ